MLGELRQRAVDVDRCLAAALADELLERRQDDGAARARERFSEYLVGGGRRGRAEIHVERDVADAGLLEPVDQLGVHGARPRPDADLLDRGRVDCDQDDVAVRAATEPAEAHGGQGVLQRRAQAGDEHQREHEQNEQMWSILLHASSPRRPRSSRIGALAASAQRTTSALMPVLLAVAVVVVGPVAVCIDIAVATYPRRCCRHCRCRPRWPCPPALPLPEVAPLTLPVPLPLPLLP